MAATQVICIGEVLIEFTRAKDGRFNLSCDGDTFNTAIYLARAGIGTAYATALGEDPYSEGLIALTGVEGISPDLILRAHGRLPGVTVIDNTGGERRALFWREASPARELFELPDWSRIAEAMMESRLIFFSGITLSLYSNVGLGRFFAALEMARQNGVRVAFDCNFRPRGWRGDLARARTVFMEALKRTDIALPAYDDEAVLWGDPSPEATVERLRAFGVGEIVIKNGPGSALVATPNSAEHVPVPEVIEPVDTTGAGDAFNASYLASRLTGETPAVATLNAHKLAAQVISHPGALMARTGSVAH